MKQIHLNLSRIRKNNNSKQLIDNIFATYGIKGLALVLSIFSTPAYINYFNNNEVLGLWFTLIAVFSWILSFDVGIGNGLRNNLVHAIVDKDQERVKKLISSAYIMMGILALLLFLVSFYLIELINWNAFLNVPTDLISNTVLILAIRIITSGIILQFWLRLIISILYAIQKNALASLLTLISSLLIFIYIVFIQNGTVEEKIIRLAIVNVITVNLPLLVTTFILFITHFKESRPHIKHFNLKLAKSITVLGGSFFIIQISLLVINSSNELLIKLFYSGSEVVDYQIYNKFFVTLTILFSLLTQPIWSSFTKAYAEKRYIWMKKIYKIFNLLAIFASLLSLLLAFFLQPVLDFWLQENTIETNTRTAMYFSLFTIITLFMYSFTSISNSIGKLKFQMIATTSAAIIKFPLAYILAIKLNNWDSIIVANIIVLLPLIIIQPVLNKKYFL